MQNCSFARLAPSWFLALDPLFLLLFLSFFSSSNSPVSGTLVKSLVHKSLHNFPISVYCSGHEALMKDLAALHREKRAEMKTALDEVIKCPARLYDLKWDISPLAIRVRGHLNSVGSRSNELDEPFTVRIHRGQVQGFGIRAAGRWI